VLEEGFHVLEAGCRIYIADMVRDASTEDSSCGCEQFRRLVANCVARILASECFLQLLEEAGFTDA